MNNKLDRHVLIRFSKKTGKVDTTLEALGNAMLRLWAMQNTTKGKVCLILNTATRTVHSEFIGTCDFPIIHKEFFDYDVPEQLWEEI